VSRAIVIGSGAGGSVSAMVLARAGWDVTILEKGPAVITGIDGTPATEFSNDELKHLRDFARADTTSEPRTYRTSDEDPEPQHGAVQNVPQTVGGGTTQWDAKTPRFWDIDFRKASLLGPVDGADVTDWPFDYAELAPIYDEVEELIGVAGDVDALGPLTRAHAPRTKALPMPAGPPQRGSQLAADGAAKLGWHAFVVPMAINSVPYGGRPACNNCGFCSGYGCPILARAGAIAPLHEALVAGAELRADAMVTALAHDGRRITAVTWRDADGRTHDESADLVVLAANPIESVRLALLSELPDPHGTLGRHLMFHWFTDGTGIFLGERLHGYRGRALTHQLDDFADPDFPGARDAAEAAGLPYLRGGVLEMGGTQMPIDEARSYQQVLGILAPTKPFGTNFKQLMRASLLRDRLLGITMMGEDLPYAGNRIDLDPTLRDWRGTPVARITYTPGVHETAAQAFYLPRIVELLRSAGADVALAIPNLPSARFPLASNTTPATMHVLGGMRMGADPATSVTDEVGRHHQLDNLVVADGGTFPSSGAHNPTLTIMATTMRNARRWT